MTATPMAGMAPFLVGFQEILERIERIPGFVLLPVEIPGPDVGRALGDFLTDNERPAIVIEPRDNEAAWRDLVAALYNAKPEPRGVVILIGSEGRLEAVHAGLRLLNQRRETVSKRLNCPLLWCGTPSFLDRSWTEAPDFWSIRAIDVRLVEEPKAESARGFAQAGPAIERPSSPPPDAIGDVDHLRKLFEAAQAQGDRPGSARLAVRLADALLAEGALDEADRIISEVIADARREEGGPGPSEDLLLQQATIERHRGRVVAAAATLGALLARPSSAPHIRVRAQLTLAGVFEDGGDLERAEAAYREALMLARASGDLHAEARALIGAYRIAASSGRAAEALEPLAQAQAIAERLGDRELGSAVAAAQALAAIGGHDLRSGKLLIAEARGMRDATREGDASVEGSGGPLIDVLILTALQDELDAVLALGEGGGGWHALRDLGGFRYHRRAFPSARGEQLTVAAAWIGTMGELAATVRGQQLIEELDPSCLAVCGICAGYRGRVTLGDVIVADRIYSFDEGERGVALDKEGKRIHEIRAFDLQKKWKVDAAYLARELDLHELSRRRPPSKEAQRRWLLHTLYAHEVEGGPPPVAHADRTRACPGWTERVKEARKEGLIIASAGRLSLTDRGRETVLDERLLYPDGLPDDPPLRIHIGAIATVKSVHQDPAIFERLRSVVRGTLGLDMESAAIGDLAERFERQSIVIKAVGDHADRDKDDSFRAFACRASAEVLLGFLQKHLEPRRTSA